MTKRDLPFGFFNVDKPLGITSHDVVAKIRRKLGVKKVGHAGTLDPLATGVLVICIGDATRLAEYVMATTKHYTARVHLGVETTTYDAEGEVTDRQDVAHVTRDDVEALLPEFTGTLDQLPPLYSAIKKGGRKLYDLARAGESVELEPREVFIESIALTAWEPPFFTLAVVCGAGTYIRSLAHDMGASLGVGAHLAALCRTRSGTFHIEDAVALDDLLEAEDPVQWLTPAARALEAFPTIHLSPADVDDVRHGRAIKWEGTLSDTIGAAIAPDGRLVAVLSLKAGHARPHKVFSSQFPV